MRLTFVAQRKMAEDPMVGTVHLGKHRANAECPLEPLRILPTTHRQVLSADMAKATTEAEVLSKARPQQGQAAWLHERSQGFQHVLTLLGG